MPVIGYGEDGLTLLAMTHQLGVLLHALNDPTDPSHCLVFYRPSFGRAGGVGSAQFGEFDSIVVTDETIYLIESKWDGSPVVLDGNVFLQPRQILRHRIFRWLFMRWPTPNTNWAEFREANEGDFGAEFGGKPLAPAGALLAHNLEFILNQVLTDPRKKIVDVLLFFYLANATPPQGVIAEAGDFLLVSLPYQALGESRYFEMG